ncbi:hypothetical protein [Rhodococcus sp. 077-4]|uniref:hypothetical protein n=1 Tax=Rhodococcus sp. 077-4 TaxID=2789271 RepID=UPI0039F5A140
MNDAELDESFRNPLDQALTRWAGTLEHQPPPDLAHVPAEDRRLLGAVVSVWQGILDPNGQGINHCAHTSYLVRNILKGVAGIDSHPVTVTVDLEFANRGGTRVSLGQRNPRIRKLANGYPTWTGHEIIYIPQWSVALDLTAGQVSLLHPTLKGCVVYPVAVRLSVEPRTGTSFPAEVIASDIGVFGQAVYTVGRANYSYREAAQWSAQQAELDRGVAHAVATLEEAGFSSD